MTIIEIPINGWSKNMNAPIAMMMPPMTKKTFDLAFPPLKFLNILVLLEGLNEGMSLEDPRGTNLTWPLEEGGYIYFPHFSHFV